VAAFRSLAYLGLWCFIEINGRDVTVTCYPLTRSPGWSPVPPASCLKIHQESAHTPDHTLFCHSSLVLHQHPTQPFCDSLQQDRDTIRSRTWSYLDRLVSSVAICSPQPRVGMCSPTLVFARFIGRWRRCKKGTIFDHHELLRLCFLSLCVADCLSLPLIQIRATTCISVLGVSRRGRRTWICFQFATMSLWLVGRLSVDVLWRVQSSVNMTSWRLHCVVLIVFLFYFFHRRCFRSRLIFQRCPQTWPSRHRTHRFDGLYIGPFPPPRTPRVRLTCQ